MKKKIKNLYFLKSSGKNESKSISANSWSERTKNPLQVVQVPELIFCRVQISPKQLCIMLIVVNINLLFVYLPLCGRHRHVFANKPFVLPNCDYMQLFSFNLLLFGLFPSSICWRLISLRSRPGINCFFFPIDSRCKSSNSKEEV